MNCHLRMVGKNYHAAFQYGSTHFTHSLRTKVKREAEVRLGVITDTLYRIENGTISVPAGADPKAFIVSGGRLTTKAKIDASLTLERMAELYEAGQMGVEANTRSTIKIHLAHLKRILKPGVAVASLGLPDVNGYVATRMKEKHRDRPIAARTIRKELQTLRSVWAWAAEHEHVAAKPSWPLKAVRLPKERGREPFRSYDQIARVLQRGKFSPVQEASLWETLFLDGQEVADLLQYVHKAASAAWVYPMMAFVAFTGCRRSEMVRSRIDDWNLEDGLVLIREKKRDTSREFTIRQIDLHPQLREIMAQWFAAHPGGQATISVRGKPITIKQATEQLRKTLKGHPKWDKVRGFHTLRHSVASILASKGIDQRYIDKVMGHQTEEMRLRYQHLFPKGMAAAINSLL